LRAFRKEFGRRRIEPYTAHYSRKGRVPYERSFRKGGILLIGEEMGKEEQLGRND